MPMQILWSASQMKKKRSLWRSRSLNSQSQRKLKQQRWVNAKKEGAVVSAAALTGRIGLVGSEGAHTPPLLEGAKAETEELVMPLVAVATAL